LAHIIISTSFSGASASCEWTIMTSDSNKQQAMIHGDCHDACVVVQGQGQKRPSAFAQLMIIITISHSDCNEVLFILKKEKSIMLFLLCFNDTTVQFMSILIFQQLCTTKPNFNFATNHKSHTNNE
jgi:hypothetical protein